jgi:hypothetical protein
MSPSLKIANTIPPGIAAKTKVAKAALTATQAAREAETTAARELAVLKDRHLRESQSQAQQITQLALNVAALKVEETRLVATHEAEVAAINARMAGLIATHQAEKAGTQTQIEQLKDRVQQFQDRRAENTSALQGQIQVIKIALAAAQATVAVEKSARAIADAKEQKYVQEILRLTASEAGARTGAEAAKEALKSAGDSYTRTEQMREKLTTEFSAREKVSQAGVSKAAETSQANTATQLASSSALASQMFTGLLALMPRAGSHFQGQGVATPPHRPGPAPQPRAPVTGQVATQGLLQAPEPRVVQL